MRKKGSSASHLALVFARMGATLFRRAVSWKIYGIYFGLTTA